MEGAVRILQDDRDRTALRRWEQRIDRVIGDRRTATLKRRDLKVTERISERYTGTDVLVRGPIDLTAIQEELKAPTDRGVDEGVIAGKHHLRNVPGERAARNISE